MEEKQKSPGSRTDPETVDVRCECGSLLARVVGERVELKCRKCKRIVAIATVTRVFPGHTHKQVGELETQIH